MLESYYQTTFPDEEEYDEEYGEQYTDKDEEQYEDEYYEDEEYDQANDPALNALLLDKQYRKNIHIEVKLGMVSLTNLNM